MTIMNSVMSDARGGSTSAVAAASMERVYISVAERDDLRYYIRGDVTRITMYQAARDD